MNSILHEANDEVVDVVVPVNFSLLFRVSMWWRIVYGGLRIILSITLLQLVGKTFSDITYTLMQHEFTGPKGDVVLERVYALFSTHDFTVTYFVAGYFLFWGTVDAVLSLCLLRHIRVAFPVAMGLIALFIGYGVFRFTHTHSMVLFGVIIMDIIILALIYHEYKRFPVLKRGG